MILGLFIILGVTIFVSFNIFRSIRETRKLEEKILGKPRTKGRSFIDEYLEKMDDIDLKYVKIAEEEGKKRAKQELKKQVHELMVRVQELNDEYNGEYNRFDILDIE